MIDEICVCEIRAAFVIILFFPLSPLSFLFSQSFFCLVQPPDISLPFSAVAKDVWSHVQTRNYTQHGVPLESMYMHTDSQSTRFPHEVVM